MNEHILAENLCRKAEALGLCHPTESMISEMLGSLLSNHMLEIDYTLRDAGYEKAAEYLMRLETTRREEQNLPSL